MLYENLFLFIISISFKWFLTSFYLIHWVHFNALAVLTFLFHYDFLPSSVEATPNNFLGWFGIWKLKGDSHMHVHTPLTSYSYTQTNIWTISAEKYFLWDLLCFYFALPSVSLGGGLQVFPSILSLPKWIERTFSSSLIILELVGAQWSSVWCSG